MANLETLYLDNNQITEIKRLKHLGKLSLLYLGFNPIKGEFEKDIMGEENVQNFLKNYKE